MRQLKITKSITNRNVGSLDKFLQEISREELITAEQEVVLAQRIKNGDQMALEKLVKANLRFVISVAKQYQNQGLSLPDLINEGNVGLIKAAHKFDETRGFKFISYAVWWIRQSILQAIAEQSRIVRLPLNQVGTINRLKKERAKLEQSLERAPTTEEMAEAMDMTYEKMKDTLGINSKSISVDAPLVEDEDINFMDVYIPEGGEQSDDIVMYESLSQDIKRSLSALTKRERDIVCMFFGIGFPHGYTYDEIGAECNLTKERVRQIKDRAIKRLRRTDCSNLKAYLG
jgi:RNA polymerase primary sigma factor